MFSALADYLYALIIYPIEMFIEAVFSISMNMIPSVGHAIIFVSIAVQLLALPMYKRADEIQEEERNKQKSLEGWVTHIKKTFTGDERFMMLSEYYRQNNYQPWYSLRGMLPLLLQIPFFIAAYHFLSGCDTLNGASFYFLKDMGKPDGLLHVGGMAINVMPVAMTLINIVSGMIYTKDLKLKDKLQLYITAAVFLVLLYSSPSGLVFYWTLNNVFSLLKNVFMKLIPRPREIISIASALIVGYITMKWYRHGAMEKENGWLVTIVVLAIGFMPLVKLIIERIRKKGEGDRIAEPVPAESSEYKPSDDKSIFVSAAVALAVLLGVMIPATTMASSPSEFVIRGHYVSPLVQLIYSLFVAAGIFVLWGYLIYTFAAPSSKRTMSFVMAAAVVCALADFQFFKQHLDNMSLHMQYYDTFNYSVPEMLVNAAVLAVLCVVVYLLFRYRKKYVIYLCNIITVTVIALSVWQMTVVAREINDTSHLKDDKYYTESDVSFTLDKNGKNVIVFMLDRAFSQFIPYLINEKPELKEIYSGFTFYPNTISYGNHTATGAPSLFGGYEYTTYNMRGLGDNETAEKRSESSKVLPKLFSDNGYKCTVLDSPGYIGRGGVAIDDFFREVDPSINAYYADNVVKTKEEAARDYEYFKYAAKKNYIRHSIFISSPLVLRRFLYDEGSYLMQDRVDDRIMYSGHKESLDKLSQMTKVSSSGDNTFTLIDNELAHSINIDLQLPDYTQADVVDNSEFEGRWREGLADVDEVTGRSINMYTDTQIQAYQINMAALLSIGEWIQYLKDNGVYDNTRIVLVADHGYFYFAFNDMLYDNDGTETDLDMFTPLLMVKDWGDGDFTVSDEFMTNADTSVIAMEGIIDDPVNPYTGNPINNDQKYERDQYVTDGVTWLSVHDNIFDINNWKQVDIEGTVTD